jgi:diguanylate cyclase (GGDEF)-like protein/PAS domain S-box-containing protein
MKDRALKGLVAWGRPLPLRLALVALVLVVPICVLATWQYRDIGHSLTSTRTEERGFRYVTVAVDLLESANRFGNAPTSDARAAVEADLQRLDTEAASMQAAGIPSGSTAGLRAAWNAVTAEPGPPKPSVLAAFGDAILLTVGDVADSSRLAFDSQVDAGELGDALDNPYLLEFQRLSSASRTAAAGLAAGGSSAQQRIAIAGDLALARSAQAPLAVDMRGAFAANPALRPVLERRWQDAEAAEASLSLPLERIMRGEARPGDDAALLAARDARLRSTGKAFTQAVSIELSAILERRVEQLREARRRLVGGVLLAFVASLGVVLLGRRIIDRRDRRELLRAQADSRALSAELARQRAERALLLTEAQFRAVFERSRMGIALLGADGSTLESNASLAAILGDEAAPLATPADAAFAALVEGRQSTYQFERRLVRGGRFLWVEIAISPVAVPQPESVVAIAMVSDITERKAANERLRHAATHDELTHLPNRAEFMRGLTDVLAHGRQAGRFAVLFIDLDGFKLVNDTLGHLAGDRVLAVTARRIRGASRPSDLVARFHGDEFGVLLRDADAAAARAVGERILAELRAPIAVAATPVFVRSSIGIVVGDASYVDAEEVVRDADAAMYHSKTSGGSRATVFDLEMHLQLAQRIGIVNDLRRGVDRREFEVVYQPVVRLAGGAVLALEALMRWNHPERGVISPTEFIPLAEKSGAILELGRFALREACALLARLDRGAPHQAPLAMNVNLSVAQLTQGDIVDDVRNALRDSGLRGERLMLEITETALLENGARAKTVLNDLKTLGVKLCLDDFGMGYSSLAYLHQFPIDALKIDRSFVGGVDGGLANAPIVEMLLRLADSLDLAVVAEGIATETQRARLLGAGCSFGQGFLFSPPLAAGDVLGWLALGTAKVKPAS